MSEIRVVGVVGAGQMGGGIAQVAAQAGFRTLLWDASEPQLKKGVSFIEGLLKKGIEKGKWTAEDSAKSRERLEVARNLGDFKQCDLVIEAIVENPEIKLDLFGKLSEACSEAAIISSNTSSISITRLARSVKNPTRFIGLHFMNPVPVMQLVEIITGLQTSQDTLDSAVRAVEKMGKVPVRGVDSPGFIVNRILVPMINEAIFLLQEGVTKEAIDAAMKLGTNQPMGPLTLADFVGLDTLLSILHILHRELGEDKYRPCPLLVKYVEAGWFGKKSGRGFYTYS